MDKAKKSLKKLEKKYEVAQGKPFVQARILKQAKKFEIKKRRVLPW